MSYIRQAKLQPDSLEVLASVSWSKAVLAVLSQHKHSFSDHVCLRLIRQTITRKILDKLPRVIQEQLFQQGCSVVRREIWSAVRDFRTPNMWVPFMYVFYQPEMKELEMPALIRSQDRLTVLDLLYNLGTPHGHQANTLKIKIFETPNISIEESYVLKRVLRGFRQLKSLILWKVCDDAMLQILGVTCHHLDNIDIWKSANATDTGIRMFLGLDAERPFRVCSSLTKVAIKDTSVTDLGAFNLMIHCDNLHTLQFSQDTFLQQLLHRISQNYALTKTVFQLRSLFLQVNKPSSLLHVVRSLPRLEEVTVWTSLSQAEDLTAEDLKSLTCLKLAGLEHASFLTDMVICVGSQLTKLCIETVQFDVDVSLIGSHCSSLEKLSIINARVTVGRQNQEEQAKFYKLRMIYLYLVQYLPVINMTNKSITTGLHYLLSESPGLVSVQAPGSFLFTDNCITSLLAQHKLASLNRFVISQPVSIDHRTVPLTEESVRGLHRGCPGLVLLGDLKHWHISPATRRRIIKKYSNCHFSVPVALGEF